MRAACNGPGSLIVPDIGEIVGEGMDAHLGTLFLMRPVSFSRVIQPASTSRRATGQIQAAGDLQGGLFDPRRDGIELAFVDKRSRTPVGPGCEAAYRVFNLWLVVAVLRLVVQVGETLGAVSIRKG